jgi:hypothetical protein
VLCGGRVSPGMELERQAVCGSGRPVNVVDLTKLGDEPPLHSAMVAMFGPESSLYRRNEGTWNVLALGVPK